MSSACKTRLFSEAVAQALSGTGEFRVEQVLPGKTDDIFSLCRAARADILLMEVSRVNAYTLESRLRLIDRVRGAVPRCQFVLLCDENGDPELAQSVKRARQDRLINDARVPVRFRYTCLSDRRAGRAVRKET